MTLHERLKPKYALSPAFSISSIVASFVSWCTIVPTISKYANSSVP